jgi:hypothetical protein
MGPVRTHCNLLHNLCKLCVVQPSYRTHMHTPWLRLIMCTHVCTSS